MLAKRLVGRAPVALARMSQRSFFDYARMADKVDAGESLESQLAQQKVASQESSSAQMDWEFIKWLEENSPESASKANNLRMQYQGYEAFINDSRLEGVATKEVNFDKFRSEIADPQFIDDLEVEHAFQLATMRSIDSMATLNEWDEDRVKEFDSEVKHAGDQLIAPYTDAERSAFQEKLKLAEKSKEVTAAYTKEISEVYAEFDAERMMLGQESMQMNLAQHPFYAEGMEDATASKQFFYDYVMLPQMVDWNRNDRAHAIKDETRRKIFLERYNYAAQVNNGQSAAPEPDDGH
jgi:hypothetical protein